MAKIQPCKIKLIQLYKMVNSELVAYYYLGDVLQNKYDLINLFWHERGGHGEDFIKNEKLGISPLYSEDRDRISWEKRACSVQLKHCSWENTSPSFKTHMRTSYPLFIH